MSYIVQTLLLRRRLGLIGLKMAAAALSVCTSIHVAVAAPSQDFPAEFTPVEIPTATPCGSIAICDVSSNNQEEQCRRNASAAFGRGNYWLYIWRRPITEPLPLLALGAVATDNYFNKGCLSSAELDDFESVPIRVFSERFRQFFFRPRGFWANAARRTYWIDLFLKGLTSPGTPGYPSTPDYCGSPSKYQNRLNPADIDGDRRVSGTDLRILMEWINTKSPNLRTYNSNSDSLYPASSTAGIPTAPKEPLYYVDPDGSCFVDGQDQQIVESALAAKPTPTNTPKPPSSPTSRPNPTETNTPGPRPTSQPTKTPDLPKPTPTNTPSSTVAIVQVVVQGALGHVLSTTDGRVCLAGQTCSWLFTIGTKVALRAQGPSFQHWLTSVVSLPRSTPDLPITATAPISTVIAVFAHTPGPTKTPTKAAPTFTPTPKVPPTATTAPPTATPSPPKATATPKPPPTNTPIPSGNIAFKGITGWIVNSFPIISSLQGCYLKTGLCAALVPPGMRIDVTIAQYNELGERLSHIFCRSRYGTHETRNNSLTLFAPSDRGDVLQCAAFYGSSGGNRIRIVGGAFYGTPVLSIPPNLISCNGTTARGCETILRRGEKFTLLWPQFIRPQNSTKDLQFCRYYCESDDGLQTLTGPKRQLTQDFGIVSTSWSCTAFYYDLPC